MIKITKYTLTVFLILVSFFARSQVVFDTIISNPDTGVYFGEVIQTAGNNYLLIGGQGDASTYNSLIYKISETGKVLTKIIVAQPNELLLKIMSVNEGYLFFGVSNPKNKIVIQLYDFDLNYQWQKEYQFFGQDTVINSSFGCIKNAENEIVFMGSAGTNYYNKLKPFTCKFSLSGDSLSFKYYPLPGSGAPNIFGIDTIPHTDKYLVAGYEFRNNPNAYECNIIRLNHQLDIDTIFVPIPPGYPYEDFWGNSQVRFISDTSFLSVSRKLIDGVNPQQEDICVQLYDTAFKMQKEISWGGAGMNYFSYWGLDFIDNNNIYIGAEAPQWYFSTVNYNMLTKIDKNLNILWTKFYGGDSGSKYDLDKVIATSDGGCLMAGMYYNNQMNYQDILLIKTDADGNTSFTTGVNKNLSEFTKDVILFPNPVVNNLNIKKGNQVQNAKISVYNFNGETVGVYDLTDNDMQINLSNLSSGTYFYKITSGTKIVDKGSFIKQQK